MQAVAQRNFRFDNFHLDALKRQLTRDGEPVQLNPKSFDLLFVLVENSGRLLTKDDLFRLVWHDQIVEESNLTVNMSAIRRALGERASQPRYITTVSGEGYRFVADVRETGDADSLIFESQSFSRIVVEQEINDIETLVDAEIVSETRSSNNRSSSSLNFPASPRLRFTSSQKLAVALITAFLALGIGGYYWQASSNQTEDLSALPSIFQNASIKRLTTSGKVSTATLSPDGKLFIYSLNEKGKYSLWLGHAEGGEPILLHPSGDAFYDSLRFAPDSASFYYVLAEPRKFRGDLYKSPVFGGAPEKLREDIHSSIAIDPDRNLFAFVRNDEENGKSFIVIANLGGTSERELVSRPIARAFNSRSLSWSPDGKMIAASAVGDDEASSEIFTITAADGEIKQLTNADWNVVRAIRWLKDGGGLVIVAQDKNSYDAWQLWHVSSVNGEARHLNQDLNTYGSALSLSADNGTLLAVQAQGMPNVWVAPTKDFSRARQITFGTFGRRDGWMNLDWTVDGKLLYGAYVGKSLTIWTMDADGGNQKQMTSAGYLDQNLSSTADGKYIVFQSNRGGSDEIWRMNADGGDLRQITAGSEPHVAPDGSRIVFKGRDRSLWRINMDGGDVARLTEKAASDPRISPEGKFIACAYESIDGMKLAVLSIEDGEPLKLFGVPSTANFRYGIRWTPDRNAITYRDWYNGIWKQNLNGGEPNRLTGLPEEKLYAYEWSRDGRQFAFVHGREIRDVVLLQSLAAR